MASLKGNESGSACARDGISAGRATFGKELSEAFGAIWLVVSGRELLPGQHGVAVGTSEAFPVPGLVLECDSAGRHYFLALGTFGRKFLLEACHTVHVRVVGNDEWFTAYGDLAGCTIETFVVPLSALVFHFLHSRTERFSASVTAGSKLQVIALAAKDLGVFDGKWLFYQGIRTFFAYEAFLEIDKMS